MPNKQIIKQTYIQNRADLINYFIEFIENGYSYSTRDIIRVDAAKNIFSVTRGSTPYSREIIINNMFIR